MEQVRADQVVKGDRVWDRDWGGARTVLCIHRKPGTMTLVFHIEDDDSLSFVDGEMVLRVCTAPVSLRRLVDQQAEDEGLWFIAETVAEAHLQQELRRLHAAVEGEEL
jgi:hypothetical protein